MEQSPRLSLSYVAPSQAQKHVTVNESFRRLDALAQAVVRSRTTTAEPASPAEGDAYIIPASATGATWSAYDEDDLAAWQDGAWAQIPPFEGVRVWVADDDEFVIYDGAAWGALSGGGSSETAAKFGINVTADATNKLSVKSDAILFSHDDVTPGSGDAQVKVNKAGPSDTASHLFQTNFSGRAEFGLTGDDDFHIKVSPDNFSTSYDALVIDKDNGYVGVGGAFTPLADFHVQKSATSVSSVFTDVAAVLERNGSCSFKTISGNSSTSYIYFADTDDGWPGAIRYSHSTDTLSFRSNSGFRMDLLNGLVIGSPTGGDKGAGTLNANAVYDDNTLLSCYVFDQALDGAIDAAKWNAKVPDRIIPAVTGRDPETGEETIVSPAATAPRDHEPAQKFAARIGTAHDPLTLDGYAKHWKEQRHLTAMPNEATFDPVNGQLTTGEWIQRLVETVEIHAVLIEELNSRVKALTPPGQQ